MKILEKFNGKAAAAGIALGAGAEVAAYAMTANDNPIKAAICVGTFGLVAVATYATNLLLTKKEPQGPQANF